jgi:hypothetical protein
LTLFNDIAVNHQITMTTRETVCGVLTDTLTIFNEKSLGNQQENAALHQHRKVLHAFFIPGNPGTLVFYAEFLRHFIQALRESTQFSVFDIIYCHAVGHADHHLATASDGASTKKRSSINAHGLSFQTMHKLDFVETTLRKYDSYLNISPNDDVSVALTGHSIGMWMVLDMLSMSTALRKRTKFIQMFMPFIFWSGLPFSHKAKLSSFRSLHPASHHIVTNIVESLLYIQPHYRRQLFKLATGLGGDLVSIVSDQLLTRRMVQNFYTMGCDEICEVKRQETRMLELLQALDTDMNIFALYTDDDVWAPVGDMRTLQSHLPHATVVYQPGLTHAYSLTPERIRKVCALVKEHYSLVGKVENSAVCQTRSML